MQADRHWRTRLSPPGGLPAAFAGAADHAECRRLHKKYGTTYYFATQSFPKKIRRQVHALYGFVRVPDEWVDTDQGRLPATLIRRRLQNYRSQLIRAMDGVRPDEPVLRAFADVMRETGMALDEPLCFLDAMEMDLSTTRYATYADLRGYMRGSAAAVGLMMLDVLGVDADEETQEAAVALAEGMQMTNFLRDVGEDIRERGRVYLPQDEMAAHGITESALAAGRVDDAWRTFAAFQIARCRELYARADTGIPTLPRHGQVAVRTARVLYARILNRIEANGYDTFTQRARTSRVEKLGVLARIGCGLRCD